MIRIFGASDDLVEVEGCDGADEFNVYGSGPVMWRADLIAPGGAQVMQVHAIYGHQSGCWSFAVGQGDEGVTFPTWPVRIDQHDEITHTVMLSIDAPEGTRLTNVWPVREDED